MAWFRQPSFSNSGKSHLLTGIHRERSAVTRLGPAGVLDGSNCKPKADKSARSRKRLSEKCRLRNNIDCHRLPRIRQHSQGPAESARELSTFWFPGCSLHSV